MLSALQMKLPNEASLPALLRDWREDAMTFLRHDAPKIILVLLVGRENIAQGETTIYADDDRDPERVALPGGHSERVAPRNGRPLGSSGTTRAGCSPTRPERR